MKIKKIPQNKCFFFTDFCVAKCSLTTTDASEPSYKPPLESLMKLVETIVPFQVKHNEETTAIDLLLEVDKIELLPGLIEAATVPRVCLYLMQTAVYVGSADDARALQKLVFDIQLKFGNYPEAQRVALKMKDQSLLEKVFESCDSLATKIQMGT